MNLAYDLRHRRHLKRYRGFWPAWDEMQECHVNHQVKMISGNFLLETELTKRCVMIMLKKLKKKTTRKLTTKFNKYYNESTSSINFV